MALALKKGLKSARWGYLQVKYPKVELVRALLEASCPFQRARLHESLVFGLMNESISFGPVAMLRIRSSRYRLPRWIGNLKFSDS